MLRSLRFTYEHGHLNCVCSVVALYTLTQSKWVFSHVRCVILEHFVPVLTCSCPLWFLILHDGWFSSWSAFLVERLFPASSCLWSYHTSRSANSHEWLSRGSHKLTCLYVCSFLGYSVVLPFKTVSRSSDLLVLSGSEVPEGWSRKPLPLSAAQGLQLHSDQDKNQHRWDLSADPRGGGRALHFSDPPG